MISVIVPVYNRISTIGRCLSSILNQSYTDWEVIVIDDGSTDGSVELISRYIQKKFEGGGRRIRLIQQEHLGAQAARNRGIRLATGEWIAFLDSDDEWCPDYLMEVVRASRGNKQTVVCAKCYVVSENKRNIWNLPGVSGNIYKDLLRQPWPMLQGMFVSRSSIEEIGYLDEKCSAYQEWDTAIRLAKSCSFIYLDKPLFVYYRDKNTNAISNNLKKNILAREYIVKKYKKDIVNLCGIKALKHHYYLLWQYSKGKLKIKFLLIYLILCICR